MKKQRNTLIAAALVFFLAGCEGEEHLAHHAYTPKNITAKVAPVEASEIPVAYVAPGVVAPVKQVQAASRIMGFIRNLNLREGDAVRKGQVLFTVDPTDIRNQAAQAQAGLAQAEAMMADAKADYERFAALLAENAVPQQQYEKMKMKYTVAQKQVAAAKSMLAQAESQMRYANIRSPIEGTVLRKMANTGDIAAPGHPILILEGAGGLEVQVQAPEHVYHDLQLGDKVLTTIAGADGEVATVVSRLSPSADPMTHTYTVKLAIPVEAKGVRSGAYAEASFSQGARKGLLVPSAALLKRAGIPGVFVVDDGGVAHYRLVRVGQKYNGQTEILSGLRAGEKVAYAAQGELLNGDRVTAESGNSAGGGNG